MKRLVVTFCFSLVVSLFFAQTQSLPDMRISGESGVKAYLYKRALLFSTLSDMGDSLPAFIPSNIPVTLDTPKSEKKKYRGYLQGELNAELGFNGFISIYPNISWLNGASDYLEFRSPDSDLWSWRNNLFLGLEPSSEIPLTLRLDFYSSEAKNFSNRNLEAALAYHTEKIDLDEFSLNSFSFQAAYNGLDQTNLTSDYKKDYVDYYCSTILKSGWLNLKCKFIGQAGEGGIQLAPLLNLEPGYITRIRIHLMADSYGWVPSVEFRYSDTLVDGGVFSVGNNPTLESNRFSTLLDVNPWISFSDAHRLQLQPLNLKAGLEFVYPSSQLFSLSRLEVHNASKYTMQCPVYVSTTNYSIPALTYKDIISNQSSIDAFFQMGELVMHQGMDFELAYLSRNSMQRVPYRPVLKLDTRLNYSLSNWLLSMDLLQNYFTKDHNGKNLNESIILNIGAEYRIDNSAIYAQLANLLNQKQWIFSEQPSRKLNIFIGAKYRF